MPVGAEGEGGAEEEGVVDEVEVATAPTPLGAGGPLMDRGSPQMGKAAGLAAVVVVEVDREVDVGVGALIHGNMPGLLPLVC